MRRLHKPHRAALLGDKQAPTLFGVRESEGSEAQQSSWIAHQLQHQPLSTLPSATVELRSTTMPASTASLLRASRPVFRSQFFTARTQASQATTGFTQSQFRAAGRRFQSTASEAAAAPEQSWLKRMWNSPIGVKTVHFWAPVMKWGIVLAGVSDFYRPAEKLSLTQNLALTATGIIWTRWCLIIKPRNILLATVNFFLGMVGVVQVSRILMWRSSPEGKAALQAISAKEAVENVAKEAKGKVEDAIKS